MNSPSASTTHRQKPQIRRGALLGAFALLLVAYAVNAMDRMVFPVLLPDVRAEYGFDLSQAGFQATLFALGMGLAGIPAGWLQRRFSRKMIIVWGTIIFSVATILTVVSVGFWDMSFWRVLSGVGEALQLSAILTVAATAFPANRGVAVGSVNMAFAAGAVIGPSAGGMLLSQFGTWRAPMIAFGIVGIVLAALILFIPRSFTERKPGAEASDAPSAVVGGADRLLSRNPLILGIIAVLFGLVNFAFIGMYGTYLREGLGFSPTTAGFIVSFAGLAAFASPLMGMLSDRLPARAVLVGLQLAVAAVAVGLFFGPAQPLWQGICSFLFGLFASSGMYTSLAALMVKSVRQDLSGVASGRFVAFVYVPAGFAGTALSSLVAWSSWGTAALIQLVGLSVIGALLALGLREREFSHTLRKDKREQAATPLDN